MIWDNHKDLYQVAEHNALHNVPVPKSKSLSWYSTSKMYILSPKVQKNLLSD